MQNEFSNYKTILSVLQILKCNYGCFRFIDTEFLPTEIFNNQAWTAIDQITEVDPLADRLIIPSFTNNASGTYDSDIAHHSCMSHCHIMWTSFGLSICHHNCMKYYCARSRFILRILACSNTVLSHRFLGFYAYVQGKCSF